MKVALSSLGRGVPLVLPFVKSDLRLPLAMRAGGPTASMSRVWSSCWMNSEVKFRPLRGSSAART